MIGHIDGEKIEIYNSLEVLNWGGGSGGRKGWMERMTMKNYEVREGMYEDKD